MANKRKKIWTSLIPAMIHKRPWIFPKDEEPYVTLLNCKHRWDLTLHAVLEFGKEHGKNMSIFLSAQQWKTRVPSEEEIGALLVPSISYVEGMKVANGSEFVAKGIVPDPNVQEHVVEEGLSIFFGPPCGILLQSEALQGLRIPHLPPDTIMLGTELIPVQKQKHGKHQTYTKGRDLKWECRGEACPVSPVSCYNGLQIAVADDGKGLTRAIRQKGW
jgi:hypothetical protein